MYYFSQLTPRAGCTHERHLCLKSIFPILVILAAFVALCSLGFWQLSRAKQKEVLLTQQAKAAQQAPLTANQLLTKNPERYTNVLLHGTLQNEYSILLDNTVKDGKAGYEIFVPIALNENTIIFVDRGWITLGSSRDILPKLKSEISEMTIEGYLDFPYRNPFISRAIEGNAIQWPLRIQQWDLNFLQAILGKKIYPMLVILNNNPRKNLSMSPERHRGYAFQWFAIAATLLVIATVVLRRKGKENNGSHHSSPT